MKPVDRPTYTVTLRPEPGVDPIRALRALLKAALRRYHLRCVDVRETLSTQQKGKATE